MAPSHAHPKGSPEAGFTYIAVLIALAISAVTAIGGLQIGSVMQRRAAEESLLDIGHQYRAALKSYAKATPAGQPTYPKTLQDLVRDPRFPNPVRHLRKIYFDPMTGTETWGLLKTPDGTGIIGIFSQSTGRPIKVGNFLAVDQAFQNKKSYTEWVFMQAPNLRPAPLPVPGLVPQPQPVPQPAPPPTTVPGSAAPPGSP